MKAKTIMIQGTGSGVGKSVIVAAFCRIFLEDGYKVAPFKAQNMSLNSFVTSRGGEIGRAQAMQAESCRLEPRVDMNPILIKPTSEAQAQVILKGRPIDNMSAKEYDDYKQYAKDIVVDSFNRLSREYEVIVIEGAGSPAEVNLRDRDIVNMFIAEIADSPVILIGDIDKGGCLAWLWGTIDLLTDKEKNRIAGLLINKFRGDIDILKPGLEFMEQKTGKRVLGVIPYFHNLRLDEEDSIPVYKTRGTLQPKDIKIEVLYLPHISNFTDFDALEREDDINLKYIHVGMHEPISGDVDVLIIPGSKSVISDFLYLEGAGYIRKIRGLAKEKKINIIGICGGYQMLGKKISDPLHIESRREEINTIGLLGIETIYEPEKVTRQVKAVHIDSGIYLEAYEIHMGRDIKINSDTSAVFRVFNSENEEILDGARDRDGLVWGTYLHGVFENKKFCRSLINRWRINKGLLPCDKSSGFLKDKEYDRLAKLVRDSLDMDLLYNILNSYC